MARGLATGLRDGPLARVLYRERFQLALHQDPEKLSSVQIRAGFPCNMSKRTNPFKFALNQA